VFRIPIANKRLQPTLAKLSAALGMNMSEATPYSGAVLAVEVHEQAWRKLAQQTAARDRVKKRGA
jgi:hypothetical protein